jgi:hypothetical protein
MDTDLVSLPDVPRKLLRSWRFREAGLLARLRRGHEFHMSKVIQLRAAVAPRGFALPQHLNLMRRDANNRAGSTRLTIILAHPNDAVA